MIDIPINFEKPLIVSEKHLEKELKYYHGRVSILEYKTEGRKDGEEKVPSPKRNGMTRDKYREKTVGIIHAKIDAWIQFYEEKCGIRLQDLGSAGGIDFRSEIIKTDLVLFLLRVDTISTIVVKEEPLVSEGKFVTKNNRDVLKYAAENFEWIYEQAQISMDTSPLLRPKDLGFLQKQSRIRASGKIKLFIEKWLSLRTIENDSRIPHIWFTTTGTPRLFQSFFEDIWFYTTRVLDQEISNVNWNKN
jgi:hypothetical protein